MKRLATGIVLLAMAGCAPAVIDTRPVQTWSGSLSADTQTDMRAAGRVNTGMFETAVAVSVAGARSGATLPWHIHSGNCGSGGPIVGDANAYPALRVGGDGSASSSARIGVPLAPTGRYHINFHASPTQLDNIVGCFNLSR